MIAIEISRAAILDINMGCPVGKIVKSGDGSALMKTPELAGKIIEAVCRCVTVPVTVKFRKGWDNGSANAVEFAKICEQAGASALTVHGRTRAQMYSGHADREIIREVKKAVSVPVTANGDIFSGKDAAKMMQYTGCDMVMIGRGCFGDPWLFARANAALRGEDEPALPPLQDRMDAAVRQIGISFPGICTGFRTRVSTGSRWSMSRRWMKSAELPHRSSETSGKTAFSS